MADDLHKVREFGEVAADMVFRHIARPKEQQIEGWLIYLSSGLFATVFEFVPVIAGSIEDEGLREEVLTAFFGAASSRASKLANDAIRGQTSIFRRGKLHYDFQERIQADIVGCFNFAVDAVDERDYDFPTARTHAVFAYVDSATRALVASGAITLSESNAEAHHGFMKGAYDFAEHMAGQVNEVLDRNKK